MDKESIRSQVFAVYDNLYEAEKKVADTILNNQNEVIDMSVSELAANAGTSQATVIRLCKKMGLDGFYQLKIEIAKEMKESDSSHSANYTNEIDINSIDKSIKNIMSGKIEEIKDTFEGINREEFDKIIKEIYSSKSVVIGALGNTIPVSLYAAYKFNQIGIRSFASTIWETQSAAVRFLDKGDVYIGISATGESKKVIEMAEKAKNNGAVTVAITNHKNSTLAQACDYSINTKTREQIFHNQVSFTRISAMAVIDCMFLFLFTLKNDSFENLSELEEVVSEDKL